MDYAKGKLIAGLEFLGVRVSVLDILRLNFHFHSLGLGLYASFLRLLL